MLINSKFSLRNSCLCFYRTHCNFYCLSIFNKNSAMLIVTTLLYFASYFSVTNICNIKLFLKVFLIYPYFTTILCNFNIIFSMLLQWIEQMWIEQMRSFHTPTHKKNFLLKLANLLTNHVNYSQTRYFFWICTIQSHIFLFFSEAALTDIPHIFFHPLIFSCLTNNRIEFFVTYFHVNQCLRY